MDAFNRAHHLVQRLDEVWRLGLTQAGLWSLARVSKKRVDLLRSRPDDLDSTFLADTSARLDRITPGVLLARRVRDLQADGLSLAAIARDCGIGEAELQAARPEGHPDERGSPSPVGEPAIDDDAARVALERLAARGQIFDATLSLAANVKHLIGDGFTAAALAAWLGWEPGAVDLLLAGELDLTDDEIDDARRRLSSIPRIVAVGTGGAVGGLAFDRQSADDAERWWQAFDVAEEAGDYSGLAGLADVCLLVVRDGAPVHPVGGAVVPVRLLTDRAGLQALIDRKRQTERRSELINLFPLADLKGSLDPDYPTGEGGE